MNFIHLLFWLLIGHSVCDYPLQGDFLAQAKNRHTALGKLFWPWALPTHALIHAGAVAFVTGSLTLGFVEFIAHSLIDFMKCENKLTFSQDQILHVLCKVAYAICVARSIVPTHPFSFT